MDETSRISFFLFSKAIEFLHSMKLIHTDLKPENVLLKSWQEREVTLDSGDVIRVPANPRIKGERMAL